MTKRKRLHGARVHRFRLTREGERRWKLSADERSYLTTNEAMMAAKRQQSHDRYMAALARKAMARADSAKAKRKRDTYGEWI